MSDIDLFLLQNGYSHTRYVDDLRIFCRSSLEAHKVLHDLSEYLYSKHKLALQPSKTRLPNVKDFLEKELYKQLNSDENQKTKEISDILLKLSAYSGTDSIEHNRSRGQLEAQARNDIIDLFDSSLEKRPLHLGFLRYVLRRAARLDTDTHTLQDRVLRNMEQLMPVTRDVAKYLLRTTQDSSEDIFRVNKALIKFIETSDFAFMPYLLLWIIDLLTERMHPEFKDRVGAICSSAYDQLGHRPYALYARKVHSLDWARTQLTNWHNNPSWDRRAIIRTSTILTERERKHWHKHIKNAGDILDRAVAKAAVDEVI